MRYRTFIYDTARWAAYEHRPGDIIISTPPKCGTTWMQNIVGMLVLGSPELDRPMVELSPWLDQTIHDLDVKVAELRALEHRRWIKAHAPLDALPWHDDVTYVVVGRDPRDVAVSMDHHMSNMDIDRIIELRGDSVGFDDIAEMPPLPEELADPVDRWWRYMENRYEAEFAYGLQFLVIHLRSFWERRHEPNVVMVHYADLQADLEGEMRRLAKRLGVTVSDDRWPAFVEAASFGAMRSRAVALAPNAGASPIWKDSTEFFHRGESGQWRSLVDESELDRYWANARDLVDDEEFLSWLHRP